MGKLAIYILVALFALSFFHIANASTVPPTCREVCLNDLVDCQDDCSWWDLFCDTDCNVDWIGCNVDCGSGSGGLNYVPTFQPAVIIYEQDATVSFAVGRHDGSGFLEGQGGVTSVLLYVLAREDIDTSVAPFSMAFQGEGDAIFNASTNHWEYNWNTSSFDSPTGYLIRAVFYDPTAQDGEISGFTFAVKNPGQPIPTLSEWGMIIFCTLLFSWMAWVIVRRRKQIA